MTADLEMLNGTTAAMAFSGSRKNIWHQLGQSFPDRLMTADEALRLAHLDREIRIVPVLPPNGAELSIPEQFFIVRSGQMFLNDEDVLVEVPEKVVGILGHGGADAHREFTDRHRFLLAEEAIHASHDEAKWSTAGSLRGGTQCFATMEAPPIVVDPNGIADVIASYMTITWSFDGTRSTELAASNIRVVCSNTMACHDSNKETVIRVRHTSHTAKDRMALAAHHWAMAQDERQALALQAERLLAVRNGKWALNRLIEKFEPRPADDASKASKTRWETRTDKIRALWEAPTNAPAVGDNGWAAWNTFVEYHDWVADVKVGKGETALDVRLGHQFDGKNDSVKANAADFILSLSN